ncbi:MAG: VOC family protein [Deltaproteobacteria bacterium]|nr:VOC family protein [Deltaproteobacteria bacterium]MBW2421282.1 VOC family protein [Deltaproteobacteria bacterium]
MSASTLEALAPYFYQVAYVVPDLAASEAWFQKILGVPSWVRMENVAFGADCSYRGRPSDSAAHLSIGFLRGSQIELIEPVRGESLYTEFLAEKGPGLHHLAFDVPDFAGTVAALGEQGLELLAQGRVGPGSEFAYFDCASAGTSVIEILGFDEGVRAFMKQLEEQSAEAARAQKETRGPAT